MKKILLILLFVLIIAAKAQAATITAASCSQADVQAAINQAVDGDTVLVPEGSCTWTSYVNLGTKKLTLQGSGMNRTVIRANTLNQVLVLMEQGRLTNFTIMKGALIISGPGSKSKFIVDHMKFDGDGECLSDAIQVASTDSEHYTGVIFANIFENACTPIEGSFTQSYMNTIRSKSPATFAGGDANGNPYDHIVYFEGNTYKKTISGNCSVVDQARSGSLVFRFNTVDTESGGEAVQITHHGLQSGGERGAYWWEYYNNLLDASRPTASSGAWPYYIRGGTGVIFNNKSIGKYSNNLIIFSSKRHYGPVQYGLGPCDGGDLWDGNTTSTNYTLFCLGGDALNCPTSGVHTGGTSANTLTDSTRGVGSMKGWIPNSMTYLASTRPWTTIHNTTKGSSCLVTTNSANTITCTLEYLHDDGLFTGGAAAYWTLPWGWTWTTMTTTTDSDDAVVKSGDTTGALAHKSFSAVAGRSYSLSYTISNLTAGEVTPTLGGSAGITRYSNGTYTEIITAVSTGGVFFTPSNKARFTIDSIIITDPDGKGWEYGDSYRLSNGYACRDQIGMGHDNVLWTPGSANTQILYPAYIWHNVKESDVEVRVLERDNAQWHEIPNQDFYEYNENCSGTSCSSGVGMGTSLPSNCTQGTGFWREDQRILYKCSSTNTWTPYYAPAKCPHPLTGLTGSCDYSILGTDGYNITGIPDILGDLDSDGAVTVTDVQLAINVFLGTETNPAIISSADVSGDGTVDVADVQKIINIILGE